MMCQILLGGKNLFILLKGRNRINIWHGTDSQKVYNLVRKIKLKHMKQE